MTILGALLLSSTCFAQQLKTYNGEYDLRSYEVDVLGISPDLLNGTATYSYYENEDLQRIRSGKFNYTGKLSINGGSATASISGNYSENNKDGKWSVNQYVEVPEIRQPGRVSTPATSGKLNFAGTYKDGLPNGLWTSTLSVTQKGKTITETYTLNFSKNVIIGNFKKTTNDGTDNSISGTLDNNGYFTGKTIVKEEGSEYQLTFNNGLLVSGIGRSIQSGNIFENFKISEDELTIFNQLLNEKDSSIIDEIPFKIVDGRNNYEIDKLISNKFINTMKSGSLYDVTPGDLSIDENKKYNWIGFKIRVLEKSETKTQKLARLNAELKAKEENLKRLEYEKLEGNLKLQYEEKIKRIEAYHLTNYQGQLIINSFARPHLYNAFKVLYVHYINQLKIENDINKRLGYVTKIDVLCDKVLFIHGIDKKVFKEQNGKLKNEKSIEELEKILELDKQN